MCIDLHGGSPYAFLLIFKFSHLNINTLTSNLALISGWILISYLITLTIIDIDYMILPNNILHFLIMYYYLNHIAPSFKGVVFYGGERFCFYASCLLVALTFFWCFCYPPAGMGLFFKLVACAFLLGGVCSCPNL